MSTKNFENVVNLSEELIKIPSVTGDIDSSREIIDLISSYFDGCRCGLRQVGVESPYLFITPESNSEPSLIFHGHLDVVPVANDSQYTPKIKGGKLFGRGSLDMKAAIAAAMVAFGLGLEDRDIGNVGLLLVTDEETGGYNGARKFIQNLTYEPEFVLSGEPTDLRIGNKAKGGVQLKITIKGSPAHASRPWQGVNAIELASEKITELVELFNHNNETDYYTTISFNKISGGDVLNKVADYAEVYADIRFVPGDDTEKVIDQVNEVLEGLDSEIEVLVEGYPAFTPKSNPYIVELKQSLRQNDTPVEFLAKNAASDIRHFNEAGIPGIVFGPGGDDSAHKDNEFVYLDQLETYFEILRKYFKEAG